MRKDFDKAKNLRLKGNSYKKISTELGIPVSTLSDWFSKITWSQKIVVSNNEKALAVTLKRLVSMNHARKKQLSEHYETARREAQVEFEKYRKDPLFIAGLCLYWGEGDKKTKGQVRIINSEAGIVRIFFNFACKFIADFPRSRYRGNLFIYPDLNEDECIQFWSTKINLSSKQFIKTTKLIGKSETRLANGIFALVMSSRFHKEKMLEWLRLLEKDL